MEYKIAGESAVRDVYSPKRGLQDHYSTDRQ